MQEEKRIEITNLIRKFISILFLLFTIFHNTFVRYAQRWKHCWSAIKIGNKIQTQNFSNEQIELDKSRTWKTQTSWMLNARNKEQKNS